MASLAEAKEWRREAGSKVSRGELRAPSKTTLREAGEKLIEGMRSGSVPDLVVIRADHSGRSGQMDV